MEKGVRKRTYGNIMKIAVASYGSPEDVSTWSGIPAHIFDQLLKSGHKVVPIALQYPKEPWYYHWLRRYHDRLNGKWFLSSVEERTLRDIGQRFDQEVAAADPEVVVVIHGDFLAYTSFPQPACIVHDCTFATIVDYYPAFSNLSARSISQGNKMYRRALRKAKAAVFSAEWASRSAIADYRTPPSKVFTIPFGANIKESPQRDNVARWIEERSKAERCQFLFLGVDWERKGGPDALRFVAELNRKAVPATLTIGGCTPEIAPDMKPFVDVVGFLRKDEGNDAKKLETLLQRSHALLVPSLAECYGCVYCEANAFGLPALGRDTGGVSEIIKDGVNGFLLASSETPEEFANRWIEVWTNRKKYDQLSLNSRKEFDERLNYEVFVKKLEGVLSSIKEPNV